MCSDTSSEAFFEAKYRDMPDPWYFEHSCYEQARYAATLQCLKGRCFQRVFEPGCSVGVLTQRVAEIAGCVEAMDISETAAVQARERCRSLKNVHITHGSLSQNMPAGSFDLILFSEIGYYFEVPILRKIAEQLAAMLLPSGVLLAVHWLGHSADHKLSGDQVHAALEALPGLNLSLRERHAGFRIDLWSKS